MLLQCKTVALAQFNIFKQERLGTWTSAWIIPVSTVAQLMLTTLLWLFLSANPQWPSHCRVTPQLNFWRRRSVPVGHFLNLLTSLLSSPLCGHGNISRLIYFLSLTACNVCDADITGHYNAKAGSKLIGGGGVWRQPVINTVYWLHLRARELIDLATGALFLLLAPLTDDSTQAHPVTGCYYGHRVYWVHANIVLNAHASRGDVCT